MKRIPTPNPSTATAVLALGTLSVGVYLVAGLGWALIVPSVLLLVYLILPDQREAIQ